jgi:hypothetical protein
VAGAAAGAAAPPEAVHGPYSAAEMNAWAAAGYFSAAGGRSVVVREAAGGGSGGGGGAGWRAIEAVWARA